jgi:hypothetical protein
VSKKENHWYLVEASLRSLWRVPGRRTLVLAALFGILVVVIVTFEPGLLASGRITLIALAIGLVSGLIGARGAFGNRGRYLAALRMPEPLELIASIDRTMTAMKRMPDSDAFAAQARALAYVLYGRGDDATRELGSVDWSKKAPMIRAIGISAEGLIDVFCRRDPRRGLELCRRARSLASVGAMVPGATQSARYYDVCVGVAEAILGLETETTAAALEQAAGVRRIPPLQLLASYGLALTEARAGNADRAAELRNFVQTTAPHATVLQLTTADFEKVPLGISPALSDAAIAGQTNTSPSSGPARSTAGTAKRGALGILGKLFGVWILLAICFLVVWQFLSSAK